jgi:hypothetical protein
LFWGVGLWPNAMRVAARMLCDRWSELMRIGILFDFDMDYDDFAKGVKYHPRP